ncbi:hypothetical protein FB005_13321 [Sinorhizobium medicae]|nr:hypothetical protein FB006_13518 [Sinorhizobium medicae]TWA35512.1 hypothetical protein FB005_13321 [Sinorhizobium medicae]
MSVIIAQDVRAAAKGDVNDSNLASVLSERSINTETGSEWTSRPIFRPAHA